MNKSELENELLILRLRIKNFEAHKSEFSLGAQARMVKSFTQRAAELGARSAALRTAQSHDPKDMQAKMEKIRDSVRSSSRGSAQLFQKK